jgi:hypothetical protein
MNSAQGNKRSQYNAGQLKRTRSVTKLMPLRTISKNISFRRKTCTVHKLTGTVDETTGATTAKWCIMKNDLIAEVTDLGKLVLL